MLYQVIVMFRVQVSYSLAVGNNTIKINCKSQSGETRTYTITINRQTASANNTGGNNTQTDNQNGTDVNITSGKYSIGTYITGSCSLEQRCQLIL